MDGCKGGAARSDALVLIGVSGDFAHKKIFPALYAIAKRGALEVPVIGVASSKWSLTQLRKHAEDGIRTSGKIDDRPALRRLVIADLGIHVAPEFDDQSRARPREFRRLSSDRPDARAHWRPGRCRYAHPARPHLATLPKLREFDWEAYRTRYDNIQHLDLIQEGENDSANRYKLSKQADVLMLFYLFSAEKLGELFERLGYPFEYETIPGNIAYYASRSTHGSTLCRVVHAWVLARSDRPRSMQFFAQALQSDVADIQQATTAEGVHLGAMAGTVDLMQRV